MNESTWQLQLFGKFELRSPDGNVVPIQNRKVQALVAVLAFNRLNGIARSELAAILWPELSVAKRSNNLRQTLVRAREALGSGAILSSRTHCRFAEDFALAPGFDEHAAQSEGTFMPSFEGAWFDRIRQGPPRRESPQLMASFLSLLEWFSENDPSRMLGLMRENLGMSIGLIYEDRRRLLSRVKEDRTLPGWLPFFKAALLLADGGYASAVEQFHLVLAVAEANNDHLLGVQTAAQLSLSAIMRNRFCEAQQCASWCAALAAKSGDPALIPTATQIQGMVLIHAGRLREGLPLLQKAEQQYKVFLDSVLIQALRAFYLSTYGFSSEAEKCLETPRKVMGETSHTLIKIICSLADAKIQAGDLDARDSVENFNQIAPLTEIHQDTKFMVFTNEELAKAYLRLGETVLAKQRAIQAREQRKSVAMAYTPWDQMRLATRN